MRVGVIGGGTVGRATARAYLEFADEVRVYDTLAERRNASLQNVLACDVIFVCVPAPALDGLLAGFPPENREARLVLKSTVSIGTTRSLGGKYGLVHLLHSPEFLTARCALTDAQYPARNVIGYWKDDGAPAWWLLNLYRRRFPGVPNYVMRSEESEAVKLIQNAYFAVQVAFWNEANSLAVHHGMNWDVILEAILADGRINRSHAQAPGPDGKFGFGGACLPKDLKLFNQALREAALPDDVSRATIVRNLWDRNREVPHVDPLDD